ncbi:MAG TPA: sigma-70 family RNA polymerase sigma factor [Acidimicrobiales bacterium]|nr:sigma-70 family RNA polymerase sigma factor [Acidimicrobiales bacterium]
MASDEAELLARARSGDAASLDALLRLHVDRVHALCRRLTGNDHDAADATQEALLAIARGIARFDGRAAFTTWAYRVATNACLDELRRRKRRPLPVDGSVAGGERTPAEGVAEAVATRVDVDAALAHLPHEFRAAVVLRDLSGLDYAEIAQVLEVPVGTVKSRIARGRALLADLLGGNPQADEERRTR